MVGPVALSKGTGARPEAPCVARETGCEAAAPTPEAAGADPPRAPVAGTLTQDPRRTSTTTSTRPTAASIV